MLLYLNTIYLVSGYDNDNVPAIQYVSSTLTPDTVHVHIQLRPFIEHIVESLVQTS